MTGPAKIGIAFTDNSLSQGLFWQPRVVLNDGTSVRPLGAIAFDPNIDREWSYTWDPLGGQKKSITNYRRSAPAEAERLFKKTLDPFLTIDQSCPAVRNSMTNVKTSRGCVPHTLRVTTVRRPRGYRLRWIPNRRGDVSFTLFGIGEVIHGNDLTIRSLHRPHVADIPVAAVPSQDDFV